MNWRIIGFKGGGGGVTKTSSIPDEWKPYITRSLARAETAADAGDLARVEGFTPEQEQALQRQADVSGFDTAAEQYGQARENLRDVSGLKDAAAAQAQEALAGQRSQAALGGSIGSARQAARDDALQARLARGFADLDRTAEQEYRDTAGGAQQLTQAGTEALSQAGKARQAQGQAEADAEYQALNRLFGLYGSAPFQSQQSHVKQGGK